jgi:hypothetical protein
MAGFLLALQHASRAARIQPKEVEAMQNRILVLSATVAAACFVGAATAQAGGVTPAKGQSAEQTQKDIGECQGLATQSSGFNPAAPPPVASAPPEVGGRVKGAAVAGAAGAAAAQVRGNQRGEELYDQASDDAKQEYRQDNAKSAAAAGAVVGGSRQRRDRREGRADEKQQAEQTQAQQSAYDQAYQGCLSGRGYTVTP